MKESIGDLVHVNRFIGSLKVFPNIGLMKGLSNIEGRGKKSVRNFIIINLMYLSWQRRFFAEVRLMEKREMKNYCRIEISGARKLKSL